MTDSRTGALRPGRLPGGRAGAVTGGVARGGERGAVTAEYAVLLPAVVVVLVAVLLAGAAAVIQVRSQDAAASAARVLARGDGEGLARQTVERMAGDGARLERAEADGFVTVTVVHPGPGPLAGIELRARAAAPIQDGGPLGTRTGVGADGGLLHAAGRHAAEVRPLDGGGRA